MKFYIARDRDNRLYLYREKPFKGDSIFICQCYNTKPKHWSELFELDESLFPEVTWENTPQEIELNLINNEK